MRAMETTPAASLDTGEEVAHVGRAQWETNRATRQESETSELGGIIYIVRRAQLGTNPGHPLDRETSKLGRIICIVERRPVGKRGVSAPRGRAGENRKQALVGHSQWEAHRATLHLRRVQARWAHHQQPRQPARKIGLPVFRVTCLLKPLR